uniref:Cysteine-rich secretory protein 2 n=1 Tax=Cynops pyrrhogaster TaxID=8330 RepID=A0A2Z5WGY6_CYNPY|nr:cysteine-rich secretory protein 2 [Cynops pyrrhogaster]
MDTLLLTMILALGLHCSTVRSQDPTLDTNNADVQKLICDKHNELRRSVVPPASDMQKVEWSTEAAATAKKVAAKCIFEHSSETERTISTSTCGENLAKASGMSLSWDDCIQEWFNENKDFKYGTGAIREGAMIGHFTQVVWGKTVRVGCAFQRCPDFGLYVCHYAPQGNIGTVITKPYEQGTPCAKCPNNCENKLCTNSCLYGDLNPDCPTYKPFCSQASVSSVCQATCGCG